MTVRPGTVYLVGAGPGDPALITVRGRELIRRADVILHDRLIDQALLDEASPSALLQDAGKSSRGDAAKQDEINAALVKHARQGSVVVRLKGGDPLVFGRGWEEREACRVAAVPCEIVPGVSSALAGPAAVGIPVTRRGMASSVAIVAAPVMDRRRWRAVAHADTLVVLMGVRELRRVVLQLKAAGRDQSTPVAIIENATLPGERLVRGDLGTIADVAEASGVRSPAVIVIGPAAGEGDLPYGPLAGRRVVITRPGSASHQLAASLRSLGADVISSPLIRIALTSPPDARLPRRAQDFDWVVFTSRNGVRGFRRLLEASGTDVRAFAHARFAVVGPVTARELEAWGIRADLEAAPARADALVHALLGRTPRPRGVLFPCGTLALDTLPRFLSEAGVRVESLAVYETTPLPLSGRARTAIEQGVDAVLLACPSAATALVQSGVAPGPAVALCIGPTTAAALVSSGWPVHVSEVHSDTGLIETLLTHMSEPVGR